MVCVMETEVPVLLHGSEAASLPISVLEDIRRTPLGPPSFPLLSALSCEMRVPVSLQEPLCSYPPSSSTSSASDF